MMLVTPLETAGGTPLAKKNFSACTRVLVAALASRALGLGYQFFEGDGCVQRYDFFSRSVAFNLLAFAPEVSGWKSFLTRA